MKRMTCQSTFFLRVGLILLVSIMILSEFTLYCSAEEEDRPLIIMTKPGEEYEVQFDSKKDTTAHTLIIQFDYTEVIDSKLQLNEPYTFERDLLFSSVYTVYFGEDILCIITFTGTESWLVVQEYAKLEITSSDYFTRLSDFTSNSDEYIVNIIELPVVQIVIILFSILPFHLRTADVIEEFQEQLETEIATLGVYGKILSLFIPILSVSLAFIMLGTLNIFG